LDIVDKQIRNDIMSDLQAAFAKSRRALSGSSAPVRGNLILQATEFTEKTVKGKVLTGPQAGTEVEIGYAGTLGQKDYTKKTGKSFVDIAKGGSLRVERVSEGTDGVLKAGWMVTFNGKPKAEGHTVIPDAVCGFVDTGRRDQEDRPKLRVNQLMIEEDKLVKTVEDLQAAIEAAYASEGAVMLFGQQGQSMIQAPFTLSGKSVDGAWVANDPAERAAETIESFGDALDQVKEVLADGGFSVVPMRGYSVGPTTAEMMETTIQEAEEKGVRARISTVDPQNWKSPTIGMRLNSALAQKGDNAVSEGAGAKLTEAFKAFADKDEAEAFAKGGWKALSNDTLTKFFASAGVELVQHPANGWATQALLEDKLDGMDRGFIVKGFQLKASAPYPAVEACKEARENYYAEMKNSVEAAIEGLRADASVKAEAKEEAKAAEKAAEAKAEELPVDDGDDLDDLLNEAMDDLGPET
jgi:hypothetical protein